MNKRRTMIITNRKVLADERLIEVMLILSIIEVWLITV